MAMGVVDLDWCIERDVACIRLSQMVIISTLQYIRFWKFTARFLWHTWRLSIFISFILDPFIYSYINCWILFKTETIWMSGFAIHISRTEKKIYFTLIWLRIEWKLSTLSILKRIKYSRCIWPVKIAVVWQTKQTNITNQSILLSWT